MSNQKYSTANEKPGPVGFINKGSECNVLFVCEHASNAIPDSLDNLGLDESAVQRHIAWDIGALKIAELLAANFDAECIYQKVSRLVVDCNRQLSSSELIPETSEDVEVPANNRLSLKERNSRINTIWKPFQNAIAESLDRRRKKGENSVLIAIHSFNPVYFGENRPWQVCLAYNRDDRLSKLLAEELQTEVPSYLIALNKPFLVEDHVDYTIPVFGEGYGIPHVLLEIRNDLILKSSDREVFGGILADSIRRAIGRLIE